MTYITILHENNHLSLVQNIPRPCTCNPISKPNLEKETKTEFRDESKESKDKINKQNRDTKCEVINKSSKELTNAQKTLLSKGFKFVPTRRKVGMGKLIADLKIWERRMRLREYFFEENEGKKICQNEYSKFKKSSNYTPSPGRERWLDEYIQTVKDEILSRLSRKFKMNITTEEEKAMRKLLYDESIVIRPSDKSSGVVIMNTEDYKLKVEKELNNNDTYKATYKNLTQKNENKKLVENLYKREIIDKDMKKYLLPKGTCPGKVQANPKIVQKKSSEKIAEIVENELSENVRNLPTYIKDTTDFLNKLNAVQRPLPDNAIMFCLDVTKLYPSVPRKEAREACKTASENRSDISISTEDVLKMMDLVIENNNFSFNGKHFLQTEGTAIGSHLGMNYACTYLGQWEENLFQNSNLQPYSYWRYVDDIWGIWEHDLDELKNFLRIVQ
ncbi:unnamed protein product [Mytilus coruscus]|uniref:Reverse transcriptase domain-containing protein n=1 Tax=Mytilus coruscus TaxID=42192 RepID=A0A6J8D3Y9_MYTCO|nr:unnamed protein product [Mytilus coruscus]